MTDRDDLPTLLHRAKSGELFVVRWNDAGDAILGIVGPLTPDDQDDVRRHGASEYYAGCLSNGYDVTGDADDYSPESLGYALHPDDI